MNNYNLDFLSDDIKNGLLKNSRVGMKVRTLKWIGGHRFEEFRYLPMIKNFVVLNVCDRLMIKGLKGGIDKQ